MTAKKPGKPRHRYKGILATPLKPGDFKGILDRLAALFDEFQIDRSAPGAETQLFFAVAKRHIPGFAMEPTGLRIKGSDEIRGAGQKPTFTAAESVMAFVDAVKLMNEGLRESEACRELIAADRWVRILDGKNLQLNQKAECIRGMYRSYRDAFKGLLTGKANDTQLMALATVYDVPFDELDQINKQIKARHR